MAFGKIWCFVALNDEVLNELGGAWDFPPKADETLNTDGLILCVLKRSC